MGSIDPQATAYGTFHGETSAQSPTNASSPKRRLLARIAGVAVALAMSGSAYVASQSQQPASRIGVTSLEAKKQQLSDAEAEAIILTGIDRERLRQHLHAYTSKPHSTDTKQDYATALYTEQQFEHLGLKAEITTVVTAVKWALAEVFKRHGTKPHKM